MLVRREVFEAVGLLDEDYFFGFEDLDFCLRARRAGFATVLAGRATVYHEGSQSLGAGRPGGSTSPRATTCSWPGGPSRRQAASLHCFADARL